jgi:hypothetical protein
MKKLFYQLKKHPDLLFINGLSIIISLIIYYQFEKKPEIPIAIIATGISITFGLRQYNIENDKMFKELFSSFNHKYDEKFNNTLNLIDNESVKNKNFQLSDEMIFILNDYLNLCAEEYLWYKKGRIDESVWKSWENGMKYYFKIAIINDFVKNQTNQKDSYYGLFEKLKL